MGTEQRLAETKGRLNDEKWGVNDGEHCLVLTKLPLKFKVQCWRIRKQFAVRW